MKTLHAVLPDFAKEVDGSLRSLGHADIAEQLANLEIASWTHDWAVDALYINLAGPRPLTSVEQAVIDTHHEHSIELENLERYVNVDVDNFNRLTGIEVIGTKDLLGDLKQIDWPEE